MQFIIYALSILGIIYFTQVVIYTVASFRLKRGKSAKAHCPVCAHIFVKEDFINGKK